MLDKKKFYIDGKWVDPNNDNDFDPKLKLELKVILASYYEGTNQIKKAIKDYYLNTINIKDKKLINILHMQRCY